MKTRLGLPTKAEMQALCERYNLRIYHLDDYAQLRKILWAGDMRGTQIVPSMAVFDELKAKGFDVKLDPARPEQGRTGCISFAKAVKK